MIEGSTSILTEHTDMIHDVKPDYYSKYLASCSSDRTVKIYELKDNKYTFVTDLKGHQGPVWQVSWAHPRFGVVLASCSYDRTVIIWKQVSENEWQKIYQYEGHELSVNGIEFAPHEFGLKLACASSDGSVSILSYKDGKWDAVKISAHKKFGCNAVSWAPAVSPDSLLTSSTGIRGVQRLATGGCDNSVKIFRFSETENTWREEEVLNKHKDWVRDVAWAPNIGVPVHVLASCSQDRSVVIWSQEVTGKAKAEWKPTVLNVFDDVVWRVSWSVTGNILAVSCGDGAVTLWKQNLDTGDWAKISSVDENS